MRGKPKPDNRQVRCDCDGVEGQGIYQVEGPHLLLQSSFGTHRVVIGLQEHRRLAKTVLKNVCNKAAAARRQPPTSLASNAAPVATLQKHTSTKAKPAKGSHAELERATVVLNAAEIA